MDDIYRHLLDKIKKLTNALYRVTDLLSDKEPLKWTLRNKAVIIYENLVSVILLTGEVKDKNYILNETLNYISQLINTLELVSMGTYVSNLNFEILKKEYINLKSFIEGSKDEIVAEQKLLPETAESIGHNGQTAKSNGQKTFIGHKADVQDSVLHKTPRKENGFKIDDRKQKIFELIKKEGAKTISEITPLFSGVSAKSVQRDLLELVRTGKLNAEGEKRWRKYKLTNAVF
ncbi:hypothetical protein KJ934_02010 [Patescibacteria group bacterium]|nr:hypothetical protein [Patescibacteria group bacterium]MBU4353468.1 hypothetical protein [Patescibacteria group bacterium]MBU4476860.1 hypothetical protein [Patescibacteria group bacterium]MCG2698863.1 hypothetical protein [Candidatus Parcubacteria bacterium]